MKEHFPLAQRINLIRCHRRVCVSLLSRRSPYIRLQQPIRTYDYYQFVIIVAVAAVVVAVIYWFIYFNCIRNVCRFLALPIAHANEQEFRSICITVRPLKCHSLLSSLCAHLTSHSSNAARTLRNGKLWENVRRTDWPLLLDFEWRYFSLVLSSPIFIAICQQRS